MIWDEKDLILIENKSTQKNVASYIKGLIELRTENSVNFRKLARNMHYDWVKEFTIGR